jgi:hypothetical protein
MQDDRTKQPGRTYEAPKVTVMSEAEVLKSFQITSAGVTWWSM